MPGRRPSGFRKEQSMNSAKPDVSEKTLTAAFVLLSLLPLFFLCLIITVLRIVALSLSADSINPIDVLLSNSRWIWNIAASCFMLLYGLIGVKVIGSRSRLCRHFSPPIRRVENDNSQALTFFVATIIPVLSIGLVDDIVATTCFWFIVVLLIPLIVRTNACFENPVLVAVGFNLYTVDFGDEGVAKRIISRRVLNNAEMVPLIRLNSQWFFVPSEKETDSE